jgi:phosphoserine aminotransferase
VRSVVADIRAGLADLYALAAEYEVVLGVGGATAFWDAAVFGLIERRSQHLVLGEFSAKFAAAVSGAPHLEAPEIRAAEPGTAPAADAGADVDSFALIHNETSTGVMPPIERPARPGALVLVDATSAAGAVQLDATQVDAYYFSLQKAFGSEGGLWVALMSPLALERAASLAGRRWVPPSLSFSEAIANSRQNQTYNTPALATLHLMRSQLRWMAGNGGLPWAADRARRSSSIVYAWAERSGFASPFVADEALRSTTTVTVDLEEWLPASLVCDVMRRHGIVDIEGYRKLGRNQLRIATFPNVAPEDVERLTAAIDFVADHT